LDPDDNQNLSFSATNCEFSFLFDDSNVTDTPWGGAIRLYAYDRTHNYVLTVTSCTFDSCWAFDGGAVYVQGTAATVIFSTGTNCSATAAGAFLYLKMLHPTSSCTVNSTTALQCNGSRATISLFTDSVTPLYVADSLNLSSNSASGIASGIRVHPHGLLWLHFSYFEENRQGNVLSLFGNNNTETVECLWVVNNTCHGNALIVVDGSYWVRLGVFLMNDADYLIGFDQSPTAALTLWKCLADAVISGTGGSPNQLVTDGINISVGHSVPWECPFTIGSPEFSNSDGFSLSRTVAPSVGVELTREFISHVPVSAKKFSSSQSLSASSRPSSSRDMDATSIPSLFESSAPLPLSRAFDRSESLKALPNSQQLVPSAVHVSSVFRSSQTNSPSLPFALSAVYSTSPPCAESLRHTTSTSDGGAAATDGALPVWLAIVIAVAAVVVVVVLVVIVCAFLIKRKTSSSAAGEDLRLESAATLGETAAGPDVWFENPEAGTLAGAVSDDGTFVLADISAPGE
jgi:hypothetical protein